MSSPAKETIYEYGPLDNKKPGLAVFVTALIARAVLSKRSLDPILAPHFHHAIANIQGSVKTRQFTIRPQFVVAICEDRATVTSQKSRKT